MIHACGFLIVACRLERQAPNLPAALGSALIITLVAINLSDALASALSVE